MQDLGWDERREHELGGSDAAGLNPARVARIDRGICTALGPGALRTTTAGQPVATGDWVLVGPGPAQGDLPAVVAIMERRSAFVRHRAGEESGGQVVAANANVVFLVASLDTPLSRPRLERYLALGWQSGARPVMVLTKADERSGPDVAAAQATVRHLAPDVEVRPVSSRTGAGVEELARDFLGPGRTAALIGPSGVGKSTLINHLVGSHAMATGETRRDGKGRHTTSHRELIVLPGRGILIDTPGMRAVGLWEADEGLTQAFGDLERLALTCRFADCRHRREPGCALTAAIDRDELDPERVTRWHKLRDELSAVADRQEDSRRRAGPGGRH